MGEGAKRKTRSGRASSGVDGDDSGVMVGDGRPRRRAAKAPVRAASWPIDDEDALTRALDALEAADPARIAPLRAVAGRPPLRRRAPGFEGLVAIIVAQQLSVASARAIEARLLARFSPCEAAGVAAASDETLRGCGLSAPKIRTLRACAQAVVSGALDLDALSGGAAEQAHAMLTAVHGVGPWTADIYLLFCLGHPDAFPAGDLALQEAARIAFGLRRRPDARKLESLAQAWRPFRAVAARLLWSYYAVAKSREGVGVAASARKGSNPAPRPAKTKTRPAARKPAAPRTRTRKTTARGKNEPARP